MTDDTLQQTLTDTLACLMSLCQENIRPNEARRRFDALKRRIRLDGELVWEEEEFDRSVHYDALLSVPGQGTISLSFCPDRALPWPLRGARRWSDQILLRVGNTALYV